MAGQQTPQRNPGLFLSLRTGLLGLNLLAWIRGQRLLQVIYRRVPQQARDRLASVLSARSAQRTCFPRTRAWERTQQGDESGWHAGSGATRDVPGVNILGYIRGEFGLAESARMYARALIDAGVPVSLFDIDLGLQHAWGDRSMEQFISEDLPHPVSIVFVNPDHLQAALDHVGRARMEHHHVIACWFWELEKIPGTWHAAIDLADEIMVSSGFIEDAFRRVTDKPIIKVPMPLTAVHDSGLQRQDFGLEEDKFIFLCTFDFHSFVARKNPWAAISAFRAAFPPERDDVRLLLKSSNGHLHTDSLRALLNLAAGDKRIIVRDEVIDRAHVHALQRCCDVYVSLHRAEGFGLGMAESMALGKPVVATAWSGNLEFMRPDNSCLVNYSLVPVRDGEYLESEGARWAEAEVSSAASAMRRLADDHAYARALGQSAQNDISTHLSPRRAAELLVKRLSELEASRGAVGLPERALPPSH